MTKRAWNIAAVVAGVCAGAAAFAAPAPREYHDLVDKYCMDCHNVIEARPEGRPLVLEDLDLNDVAKDAAEWERVVKKLAVGAMPPQGKAHPGAEQMQDRKSVV